MPERYTKRLVDHLRHDSYEPSTFERLVEDLGVPEDDVETFRDAVDFLERDEEIVVDKSTGKIRLPEMGGQVEGLFRKTTRGFGFVIPDKPYREGDLFIPARYTGTALSGDRVLADVVRGKRRGENETSGRIVKVLSRRRKAFAGELERRGGMWLVLPDGRELTDPVVVRDAEAKNARAGDKVIVEILEYPEGGQLGEGVIVRVLGEAGKPDVETQAVIAAYDLPEEFPESCLEQARGVTDRFEEELEEGERSGFEGRLDLRDEFIITIDPPDAKDYDDAISIKRTAEGWELGVHIADVAHFVERGTAMDKEAERRGNSVYLPRLVIPMLPELLSNGICSLAEGVTRFSKSAFMAYRRDGKIVKEGVAQTVIRSAKRLTYLEAQALIDGDVEEAKRHAKTEPEYTDELIGALKEMDALARAIRERRRKAGMIHLELPEVVLEYDEHGHVIDAHPEDDAFTHKVIEMFMVEANEVLARLFEDVGVPLLRRIHPEPTPGDIQELQMSARVAGFRVPKNPTREELQALLEATAGTGAARAVHMAVLRTLTKAVYSPALIGHFALASSAYAHFTSPIRRYPDLTVHRTLAEFLRLTDNGQNRPRKPGQRRELGARLRDSRTGYSMEELTRIGRHCTNTEQNAEDAENGLRKFLVLQLLSKHVGEVFEGVVTGVSPSGVFVQLEKYLVDGMMKSHDLPTGRSQPGGRWQIDPRTGALAHSISGRSFNIGDKLQVSIAAIDLALRTMDLVVADPDARGKGKPKKAPDKVAGGLDGGGISLDWEKLKHGTPGSTRRSRKSKARDRGKADHRDPGKGKKRKKK